MQLLIAELLIEVKPGLIARVPDLGAERIGHDGQRRQIHGVAARLRADLFPVEEDGEGEQVPGDLVQHEPGLLPRLLLVDGLREEIHAHVKPGVNGTLQILLEIRVLLNGSLRIPAVADAENGKLHAAFRDALPVDLLLVRGDVDADLAGYGVAFIAQEAAVHIKAGRIICIFRNFLRLVHGARLDRRELLVILRTDGRVRAVVEQSAQQGRQPPDHKRCQQHKNHDHQRPGAPRTFACLTHELILCK